jgi:hypothetical protein
MLLDALVAANQARQLAANILGGNTQEEIDQARAWLSNKQRGIKEVNLWLRQQAVQRRKLNRQQTHSRTSMVMQLLRQALVEETNKPEAATQQLAGAQHGA